MSAFKMSVEVSVVENGRKAPEYTIDTDLNGELTLAELLEFTKATLILVADQALREEQALGFDKNPVVLVDNKAGKPILSVDPLGKIEFVSKANMDELLLETMTSLVIKSPILTGRYLKSHYVFWRGNQVATNLTELYAWLKTGPQFKDGDLIRFVNIQPYARKLERTGVTSGQGRFNTYNPRTAKSRGQRGKQGGRVLTPNGAYYIVSRSIIRKYKGNAAIKFDFIPGSELGLHATFKKISSRRKRVARTYLYPTITIRVQEAGIE